MHFFIIIYCWFVCLASGLAIRLAGVGSTSTEGRVEVNLNGQGWGTICDDHWSLEDGDVACRMLGFVAAIDVKKRAFYGEGAGSIVLDDLLCGGGENSLLDCSNAGTNVHNCQHSEDAGVMCTGECG